DPRVDALASRTRGHVVSFGRAASADVRAEGVSLDDDARATFTVLAGDERARVSLRMPGEHMVSNALAAAAAARAAGVSLQGTADGLARAEGSAWRMELHDVGGRRILNDAYNANPDSTAAALKAIAVLRARMEPDAVVLVKASRAAGLERVALALEVPDA